MKILWKLLEENQKNVIHCKDFNSCQILEVELVQCLDLFTFIELGSGLLSLVLSKLREDFAFQISSTFSIFPTRNTEDDLLLSPYNTILALHHLIENAGKTR